MTAPTLIIGLGGIGSEIVSKVEEKTRKLGIDTSNIKYILVDTDNRALQERKEKGFTGETIRISNNITVESCVNLNRYAKDEWYPNNRVFLNKTLTDGAGQVRAISRLALEHSISQGMLQPLCDAIFDLHLTHKNKNAKTFRVAIVSSLAGGTGSGLVLPFAMYLVDYLKTNFYDNGYNINGFFMMPDIVLMGKEDNRIEKISINSNAYATIKELDNFIQNYIGTGHSKASVKMSHSRRDNSDNALYNFNFLFGLYNDDGVSSSLKSQKDYKDMMVDCIYLPYCSPINEENTSWEDNKLKHLSIMLTLNKDKEYKNLGSIGVAMLQYPYKKISNYLTLRWIKDIMTETWFYYDEEYDKEIAKNNEMGITACSLVNRRNFYRDIVEMDSKKSPKSFSKVIVNGIEKNINEEERSMLWDVYLNHLEEYIQRRVKEASDAELLKYKEASLMLLKKIKKHNGIIWSLSKEMSEKFTSTYYEYFNKMKNISDQMVERLDRQLAAELFLPHSLDESKDKEYYLEYWIQNGVKGEMMHPNTVRYFLSYVYKYMHERFKDLKECLEIEQGVINDITKNKSNVPIIPKKQLQEKINMALKRFESKNEKEVMLYCMQEGLMRVEQLCGSYEKLFDEYIWGIGQIEGRIENAFDEINKQYGTRTEKICSSSEQLEEFFIEMKNYSNRYYGVSDKVFKNIFETAEEISQPESRVNQSKDRKWETLINKWEENFEESYGELYNIDVISALEIHVRHEKKKSYEFGQVPEAALRLGMEEILEYCAEQLSAPFMNVNLVQDKNRIRENYFHNSLIDLEGLKKEIVEKELRSRSGVSENKVIDKYTVYFYQSLFGIHANNLSPFKKDGYCYNNYDEVTKYIHMNENKEQVLTPHIDRSWHRSDILPELNSDIQNDIQISEWEALLYGIIMDKQIQKINNKYNIKASNIRHDECNNLWEVMDIIREFREDKDAINDSRDKDFKSIKAECLNGYMKGAFYVDYYVKSLIIEDVFLAYIGSLDTDKCYIEDIVLFIDAWENILIGYLSRYMQNYKENLKECINVKVKELNMKSKEEVLGKPEENKESYTRKQQALMGLNFELKRRSYMEIDSTFFK